MAIGNDNTIVFNHENINRRLDYGYIDDLYKYIGGKYQMFL